MTHMRQQFLKKKKTVLPPGAKNINSYENPKENSSARKT